MSAIVRVGDKVRLGVGSYASFKRTFTAEDVRYFAAFLKDDDPVHFKLESLKSLGFEKPFVYGIMPTSLFSKLYLSTFISPVYLSQSVNFLTPIYIDEELEIGLKIASLEKTKSNKIKCSMESYVIRVEKNIQAISGTGLLLLKPETTDIISES